MAGRGRRVPCRDHARHTKIGDDLEMCLVGARQSACLGCRRGGVVLSLRKISRRYCPARYPASYHLEGNRKINRVYTNGFSKACV